MLVLERVDEAAGIAGGDHHDAPFYAGIVERFLEIPVRQVVEGECGEEHRKAVRRSVRCQEQEKHVLVGIHLVRDPASARRKLVTLATGVSSTVRGLLTSRSERP